MGHLALTPALTILKIGVYNQSIQGKKNLPVLKLFYNLFMVHHALTPALTDISIWYL